MCSEKVNSIIGIVDVFTSGILAALAYNMSRKLYYKPRIKLNLIRLEKGLRNEYDLVIENIAKYNLYNLHIKLKEFDYITYGFNDPEADNDIKEITGILNNDVPVFTVGQIYRTFLLNAYLNKNIGQLNFILEYKVGNRWYNITHKEHLKFDVKSLICMSMIQD